MAIYIALSNLTDEGRKTIKQRPQRIKEVNKEIEAMGIKVLRPAWSPARSLFPILPRALSTARLHRSGPMPLA